MQIVAYLDDDNEKGCILNIYFSSKHTHVLDTGGWLFVTIETLIITPPTSSLGQLKAECLMDLQHHTPTGYCLVANSAVLHIHGHSYYTYDYW